MSSVDEKRQLTAAYYYSYTRFILNFYSLCEDMENAEPSDTLMQYAGQLTKEASSFLKGKRNISHLDEMRSQVLDILEEITHDLDWYQIHGYALERAKRRVHGELPLSMAPETVADDLIDFVVDGENTLLMNQRIQMIVGELPVRFTKSKFYSILRDSLEPYIGTEQKNLDRMLERIRSAAAVGAPRLWTGDEEAQNYADRLFCDVQKTAVKMEQYDYLKLTKEEYDSLRKRYDVMYESLTSFLGQIVLLPDLISDLYVMELTGDQAEDSPYRQELEEILDKVLSCFSKPEGDFAKTVDEKDADFLQPLEGKQEYYWEQYLKYRSKIQDGSDEMGELLYTTGQLISGSFSAPLKKEEASPEVTREVFDGLLEELCGELELRMKHIPKYTARAVMAKVLSEIPVWFNSLDEVESYIRDSLKLCLDESERDACMLNLKQMMVEENALV